VRGDFYCSTAFFNTNKLSNKNRLGEKKIRLLLSNSYHRSPEFIKDRLIDKEALSKKVEKH